ncbi:hypothetical protein CBS147343_7617 [Aspergillus niger]|nr:hypothetical protein CBS12448_8996 [Aspergillus niger]KAI2917094.1 hypothetical protein CBS147320_9379 [Aspergillus niger]KAI2935233.1 hypothetical protein CBS147321_8988 [Aspergillus niger]KAI2941840.1 hypothetical protein CBS147322_9179 [Aspergillus niger]KAI2973881.1 hypothetical protein CBS147324_3831 [Aspergillus niger]
MIYPVPQIPLRHGFGKSPSTLPSFDHDSLSCCTAADTTKDDEEALSAMIAFNVLFNPYSLILTYFSLLLPVRGFVRSETDRIPSGQDLRPIPEEIYNSLDELARVVDVAYCVGSTGLQKPFQCLSHCSDLKGFELITTWNTGPFLSDSCGYIAVSHSPSPNRIIVAFRGTYSITNTIVDLSAYPQAYVPYNTGHKNGKKEPSCYNCTVHAGFFTSWQNTRSTILDHVAAAREQYPDYKLVLVGHSLGGAVAALAGIEMQLRGWEPTVTTFGEPKVGNRAFADFLGKIFRLDENSAWRFRRVTHVYDPVPLLPLEEWGYAMHAGEIFISKEDLPPSVDDVHFCEGPRDARCISGEGGEMALAVALHERASLAADAKSQAGWADAESTEQHNMPDGHISQTPLHVQKGAMKHRGLFDLPRRLIPSRYHLWELLFSHRDYFWRVGLCVPGRDRAGKGWWTSDS